MRTGASALALDAAHISILSTQNALQDGTLLPLTLTFVHAGSVTTKARMSKPAKAGAASKAGLFGLTDICIVADGEPDGWRLQIRTEDFTFSEGLLALCHVPGGGHGHRYVGRMKLGRMFPDTAFIGALPRGRHVVRVTLNTNDHRAYIIDDMPVSASIVIEAN